MDSTKKVLAKIGVAAFTLSLALGVNYLYAAWTGPGSNTAPAGNVSTPINVSSTDQIKNGGALGVAALSWGSSNTTNGLSADQGGAIELGGQNAVKNPTNNATPYIDFHFGTGSAQDYNFRLINSATNQLSFSNSAGKTFVMTAAGGLTFPDNTTQTTAASNGVTVDGGGFIAQNSSANLGSTFKVATFGAQCFCGGSDDKSPGFQIYKSGANYIAQLASSAQNHASITVSGSLQCSSGAVAVGSEGDICVQLSGSSVVVYTGNHVQVTYVMFH